MKSFQQLQKTCQYYEITKTNATTETIKKKKSISQNQFESLICLLDL